MNPDKLKQMQGQVRIGGKGSVRRKKKVVKKKAGGDDKRLQATLKRLQAMNIPQIEEVNMFREDGMVIHFTNPKVQAATNANTYSVTGTAEEKSVQELLPGIINQLGADGLANLKEFANSMHKAGGDDDVPELAELGDDDVPDLVENFDEKKESS